MSAINANIVVDTTTLTLSPSTTTLTTVVEPITLTVSTASSGGGGGNPNEILNGTSNVAISTVDGNIDFAVGGSDVARFSTTGAAYPAVFTVQGNINAFNNITAEPGALFVGDGGGLSNVAGNSISGVVVSAPGGSGTANIYGIAIGSSPVAGQESISIGVSANSAGLAPSIAIGKDSKATGQETIAIGHVTKASGTTAIAIGHNANANNARSIVLNAGAQPTGAPAADTFTVKPVRNAGASGLPAGFQQVAYNPTTGEFVYYS